MKMNKKIIPLLIILLLLVSSVAGLSIKNFFKSGDLLSKDTRMATISVFFLAMSYSILYTVTTDLSNNMTTYILQNPPVYSEGFRSMIGFFISLIQPFYILAIILTAFYIMFVSDSYVRRSRAKSMLAKLVVGLIITSFSLPILWTFFGLSEAVTSSILNQGMVDRAIDEYNHAIRKTYSMMFYSVILGNVERINVFIRGLPSETAWSTPGRSGGSVEYTRRWAVNWKNFVKVVKIKGTLERVTPFLMLFTVLFGGLYVLISIRYVMTMIWVLLFPLMVFFLSFNMTRRVGRTMMEQTILWTVLQVFYAVIFTVVGAALTILPPKMYSAYVLTYHGFGESARLLGGLLEFSMFTAVACMVLYLGPVVLFNMFQKLFPP